MQIKRNIHSFSFSIRVNLFYNEELYAYKYLKKFLIKIKKKIISKIKNLRKNFKILEK